MSLYQFDVTIYQQLFVLGCYEQSVPCLHAHDFALVGGYCACSLQYNKHNKCVLLDSFYVCGAVNVVDACGKVGAIGNLHSLIFAGGVLGAVVIEYSVVDGLGSLFCVQLTVVAVFVLLELVGYVVCINGVVVAVNVIFEVDQNLYFGKSCAEKGKPSQGNVRHL